MQQGMDNAILSSGFEGFMTNRQNSKINYLQQENKQLLQDNYDLQHALKMNKEIINILNDKNVQQNSINTTLNIQQTKIQQNKFQLNQQQTIQKLNNENKILLQSFQRITKERNLQTTKALIQDQQAQEAQQFEKEVAQEYEDKILELRRSIHDKEFIIQELEKIKPQYDYKDGSITRFREIITPNEQSIKLHSELAQYMNIINKLTLNNQLLTEKVDMLNQFNKELKRELIKQRVTITNPVIFQSAQNNYKAKESGYNSDNSKDFQSYMIGDICAYEQQIQDFKDQKEINSELLPVDTQRLTDNISTRFKEDGVFSNRGGNITQNTNYKEKLMKMETYMKNYKILYNKEMINNVSLTNQIEELSLHIQNLENTNGTLIESNNEYQKQILQIKTEKKFYRYQYQKFLNYLRSRSKRINSLPKDMKMLNPMKNHKLVKLDDKFETPLAKEQRDTVKKIDQELPIFDRREFNRIFKLDPEDSRLELQKCEQIDDFNNQIAKYYLINQQENLNREVKRLGDNFKVNFKNTKKFRSLSDPTDYYSNFSQLNIKMKETLLLPENDKKQLEVIENLQDKLKALNMQSRINNVSKIQPFNLEISQIIFKPQNTIFIDKTIAGDRTILQGKHFQKGNNNVLDFIKGDNILRDLH